MARAKRITLTSDELVAALLAEYDLPELLPDDITAARLSAQSRHRHAYWLAILEARVTVGELVKVMCYNPATKRPVAAFRPKPKA